MTDSKNIRYQNAKIYKLVNTVDDKVYVGYTCLDSLQKRIYAYKYNLYKPKYLENPLYKHIRRLGGLARFKIILLEKFPCNDKMELLQRHQYWVDKLKPELNKDEITTDEIIIIPDMSDI